MRSFDFGGDKNNLKKRLGHFFKRMILALHIAFVALSSSRASAQYTEMPSGKIGKGKKNIQRQTCLVSVKVSGLNEGDLAEVIDSSSARVAVVRLERLPPPSGKLVANVLSGEEKCSALKGLTVRPLPVVGNNFKTNYKNDKPSKVSLSIQYAVSQNSLPGLALNKFLSPGYTQRGLGIRASGFEAVTISKLKLNLLGEIQWIGSNTSPPLDLVKNGKIQGNQSLSTQSFRVKGGAQYLYSNQKFWSGAGAILYDSMSTKSSLEALTTDPVYAAVRPVAAQSFGVFAEQGFNLPGMVKLSITGGVNFATSASTPILEDGDATNTSAKFTVPSPPLFAGANLQIPVLPWLFTEVVFDYRMMSLQLPLINAQTTKAQMEVLSVFAGMGLQF